MNERHVGKEDLPGRLDRWVEGGVISRGQADAILVMEGGEGPPERRVPLVTEALGYLGTALALAAGIVLLARSWQDIPPEIRLLVAGGAAGLPLVAGVPLEGAEEAAFRRLGSVLWFLSAGAMGWFLVVLARDFLDASAEDARLIVGAGTALYAGMLYAARRRSLQQIALLAGCAIAVFDLGWRLGPRHDPWIDPLPTWSGLAVWGLGVAWAVLAWRRVVRPKPTAYALGSLAALVGPLLVSSEARDFGLVLGLVTAAALVAASVALRATVLLGFGAIGLFAYLLWNIGERFGDTLGTPLVLLLAGVALLAVALLTARLKRFTAPPPGPA